MTKKNTPRPPTCMARTIIPLPMAQHHRHNEIELNYFPKGEITYLYGGRMVTLKSARINVLWGAVPHQLVKVQDCPEFHYLTLPLGWFLQWELPSTLTRNVLNGEVVVGAREPQPKFWVPFFTTWEHDLDDALGSSRAIAMLEIEACLRRLAATRQILGESLPSPQAEPANKTRHSSLDRVEGMTRFMALNYTRPLSIKQIAAAASLHPNYAMSLFKKQTALSILNYLTRMRVSHAQQMLVTSNKKILAIAMDAGFGSAPRFYTAFKKACSCTPQEYRKKIRESQMGQD